MKKFWYGLIVGVVLAFPLGINFGKGGPLLSNPFAKPDIKERVVQGAEKTLEQAKEVVHEATKPAKNN